MSLLNETPRILIVVGSETDHDVISGATDTLESFSVAYRLTISSAHRTPDRTIQIARNAEKDGFKVIIAAAGWSAGLPGAIAAETILPVIGIPVPSSVLLGMDAMLSMVQMPPGVPVATMAVGKGGAKNAALLALQILAIEFTELKTRLLEYKKTLAQKVIKTSEKLEYNYSPGKQVPKS
ncbi:5-(carboxyamino)imidazole ribonucleotide mutase [bacterium]|nr:5-(carboxyamino)imidazole ribonucleotide mutase [candidate division CSSED10-310 bacterium]